MDFVFRDINVDELDLIKSLWEKLNQLHMQDSIYFKEHYKTNTFEKRCKKFWQKDKKDIKIEIVEDEDAVIIGYCISTLEKAKGEIESLFIEEKFRKNRLGNMLISNAIKWLKERRCNTILVSVADGHEDVFDFYMKNGFYPRLTYLELKE